MDRVELAEQLIVQCEGRELTAYRDSGGIWTIGNGTTHYPDGTAVSEGDTCTEEQASYLLTDHLNRFVLPDVDKITAGITVPDKVYAALCSFAYNEGSKALYGHSIFKAISDKDWYELAQAFKKYDEVNGQVCKGLVNRRNIEIKFFSDSYFSKGIIAGE